MKPPALFLALAATGLAGPLLAQQNVPQRDQANLASPPGGIAAPDDPAAPRVPADAIPNPPASPGDRDLGDQVILKESPRYQAFFASVEASVNGTSNVGLVNKGAEADVFFVGQVAVSWQPRLKVPNVAFDISVSQAFFKYGRFSQFDFDTLNAGTGVSVNWKGLNWSLRYNYNRLTDGDGHEEFFNQHSIIASVQKTWSLNSATAFYAGVQARKNWTDPGFPQRDEYTLYGGARVQLSRSLSLDATYRAALHHYTFQRRNDFNQVLAVAARWTPRPWLAVTASTTFAFNTSEKKVFDYRAANGGLALSVSVKF